MVEEKEDTISFLHGDKEILKLCKNGDILIKGEKVTNDVEVVYGIREILKNLENRALYDKGYPIRQNHHRSSQPA